MNYARADVIYGWNPDSQMCAFLFPIVYADDKDLRQAWVCNGLQPPGLRQGSQGRGHSRPLLGNKKGTQFWKEYLFKFQGASLDSKERLCHWGRE